MGVAYNPKIVTNGLVMALDAANPNKSAKGFKNLLDLSTWTLGTGSVTGFSVNGSVAENQRILDTGPFGVSALVWDTPSNDVTSDADGGWNTSLINIDPTKMYRFSVWMRRKIIGDGLYYLGCNGYNASNTNEGVLNRSDGATNTNAYFAAAGWPTASVPANSWMLVVGHIWPAGSGTGAVHVNSGLYNTSGTKITATNDFVWQATNTKTVHRSYLYYSTDTTTNQQWYQPRIDLVDGTEPTIAELISGVGSKWYDLVGSNHGTILNGSALYNSNGYMNFDGVDDYINVQCASNTIRAYNSTTQFVVKLPVYSGGQRNILSYRSANSLYIGKVNGGIYCYYNTLSPSPAYIVGSITDNTIAHVAVTCDATNNLLSTYINGSLAGSVSRTGWTTTYNTTMTLGGSDIEYLVGNFYQFSHYDRVLSAAEIQQNFNAIRGRYGI